MKTTVHSQGVELTDKEKIEIEGKLGKLARFLKEEPVLIDAFVIDESGNGEKSGTDQVVHLNVTFGKEKIFIEEKQDNHMKAFNIAYKRLKRTLERNHDKQVSRFRRVGRKLGRIIDIIRRQD